MGKELLAKDSSNTLFQTPDLQRFNLPLTVDCSTSEKTTAGLTSSASSSTIEKGHEVLWTGYEDDDIPDKTQGKFMRNLRHQVFSLYRRLFGIVFIVNMAILIATFVQGAPNAMQLGQIVIGNIFCSVLMRQEHVINAFFAVFTAVPPSYVVVPLPGSWVLIYVLAGRWLFVECALECTGSEASILGLQYQRQCGSLFLLSKRPGRLYWLDLYVNWLHLSPSFLTFHQTRLR